MELQTRRKSFRVSMICLFILLLFSFDISSIISITSARVRSRDWLVRKKRPEKYIKNYLSVNKKLNLSVRWGFCFEGRDLPHQFKYIASFLFPRLLGIFFFGLGEETGGGWNIKINKEEYYWRISFRLKNMNDK